MASSDLGLCGPQRQAFSHNGVLHSLADVVDFYNSSDSDPARWYPLVDGVAQKFDDLPLQHRRKLTLKPPLDGRPAGSATPMNAAERADAGLPRLSAGAARRGLQIGIRPGP